MELGGEPETATENIEGKLLPELLAYEPSKDKGNALVLFVITIMLFFTSKVISADVTSVLVLIFVLLFHELGHFAAMKIAKYRDVQIFFIPFIGAAVSGSKKKDSVAKSCIVSLMGPLPGVLLAVLSFIVFGLTHEYLFLKLCEVLLLLNVFNLLPILPLDGGRFIETLFNDSLVLRSIYSVLSALILVAIAVALENVFLAIVALSSVILFFGNLGVWKIGIEYKKKGLSASSLAELAANKGEALEIIQRLAILKPKAFSPNFKTAAVHGHLETIFHILGFKKARKLTKAFLFLLFSVALLVSLLLILAFGLINYREVTVQKMVDGSQLTISQTYSLGRLESEVPINAKGEYDGKGQVFSSDASAAEPVISDFHYVDGYRNGIWNYYDAAGNVEKQVTYDRGKFVSETVFAASLPKTLDKAHLPFMKGLREYVREISQPRKTLAGHF
jgi:Zn-dependent protease